MSTIRTGLFMNRRAVNRSVFQQAINAIRRLLSEDGDTLTTEAGDGLVLE